MLLFAIAKHLYLAFEDGSPIFKRIIFHSNYLISILLYTGLLPSPDSFFQRILQFINTNRLIHFRSPLLMESRLISFPTVT